MMNGNGLSEKFKIAFPNVPLVVREPQSFYQEINPDWLVGFVTGEGCFLINIFKSSSMKYGYQVKLRFTINQHSRDAALLRSLVKYFNCGNYQSYSNRDAGDFVVTKFSDITDKIIPFFEKYPIKGVKALDFLDFRRVALLMKAGVHLTVDGVEQIRVIKERMNRGRLS